MALTPDKISSIKNTIDQKPDPLQDLGGTVVSTIKDPLGGVVSKVFSQINSLNGVLSSKIDGLLEDIAESVSSVSGASVSLENQTLVITVSRKDLEQTQVLKSRIETKIENIKRLIETIQKVIKTIQTLEKAASLLMVALSIQEAALTLNPTTGPIFKVLKKGIQLIFLKDIIKEYVNIIKRQSLASVQTLEKSLDRFRDIQVSLKIRDEGDKGSIVTKEEAEDLIAKDLLGDGVTVDNSVFVAANGISYRLVVEP